MAPGEGATMADKKPQLRYHCVSVLAGPDACPDALDLGRARILSAEAPRLPLATCDRPSDCRCRYQHHDDRRAGARRAGERGELADPWVNTERRRARGRRAGDVPRQA
jgi:hypothetical protein